MSEDIIGCLNLSVCLAISGGRPGKLLHTTIHRAALPNNYVDPKCQWKESNHKVLTGDEKSFWKRPPRCKCVNKGAHSPLLTIHPAACALEYGLNPSQVFRVATT